MLFSRFILSTQTHTLKPTVKQLSKSYIFNGNMNRNKIIVTSSELAKCTYEYDDNIQLEMDGDGDGGGIDCASIILL